MALGDDSFLHDLEGLGEDSDDDMQNDLATHGQHNGSALNGPRVKKEDLDDLGSESNDEDRMDDGTLEQKVKADLPEFETVLHKIKGDTLDSVASLRKTRRYQDHIGRVNSTIHLQNPSLSMPLEADPEYQLIVASNRLVQDIDEEIINVHRFIVELYSKKFPELESLVPGKLDYVRTVQRIGNEMDATEIDLGDLLPQATVMVVSVTASSTSGKPLADYEVREVFAACEEVLTLFEDRAKILTFVENRMTIIAPNICALVGSKVASQLMGLAGGLVALSRIPANHIQILGQEKKTLQGLAAAQGIPHAGVILFSELVMAAPPALKLKAMRLAASKVALAARMDAYQQSASGDGGRSLREECEEKIDKWQEPQKGKEKKALPVPDEVQRKKRGGKRVRKFKERFEMTEMRKEANRRTFAGANPGEYGDDAMGYDVGMLGSQGGKIRLPGQKEVKQSISKKRKMEVAKLGGSSGATHGMASSLVFTPTQGLELHNPNAEAEKRRRLEELNKKWFDQSSGFASARPR